MKPATSFDSASVIFGAISTVLGIQVDEVEAFAVDGMFVKLGGDSLAAILVAAECEKRGIHIPAISFLGDSNINDTVKKATISPQILRDPSTTSLEPISTTSLPRRRLSDALINGSVSHTWSAHDICLPASSLCSRYTDTNNPQVVKRPDCNDGEQTLTATDLLDRIDLTKWTEMQILLLQETSKNHKLNFLTIHDVYDGDWDAQAVSETWIKTIMAEPIFQSLIVELDISVRQFMSYRIINVDNEDDFRRECHNASPIDLGLSHLSVVHYSRTSIALIWRIHHAFVDGFSARLLRDNIRRNTLGDPQQPTPCPLFRDAVEELKGIQHVRREATRRFWDDKRATFSQSVGELSLNSQRAHDQDCSQNSITVALPEADLAAAQVRTGITTTVYLAAAWALTLGKFTDADQIHFGMTFSGRDLPITGAFHLVGPLINTLPLYVQLPVRTDSQQSVNDFLRDIQCGIFELNSVQHSETTDGFDRRFSSIMATQFEDPGHSGQVPVEDLSLPFMQAGTPLNLVVRGQSILQLIYSTSQFSETDTRNISSVFLHALRSILEGEKHSASASLIQDQVMPHEMEHCIKQWSNCESTETLDDSKGDDIVTLFENVVARQPNAVAVTSGPGESMSYDEFDTAAAAIAEKLSWIEPNEAVCVYADRSVNWMVAIFGVLKAGGVYTPLDPSAPASVRHSNFAHSGARAIIYPATSSLTVSEQPDRCIPLDVATILELNASRGGRLSQASFQRRRTARPDDLAYVCFTSGSTGQPKAVQCTHKGLVAFQKDFTVRLCARKGSVVAQVMSPAFDGSIHEIFSALTYGATLRLPNRNAQNNPLEHLEDCESAILTPSIASALDAERYPRLRNVYLVGEAVSPSVRDAWTKSHRVFNMYGPTEATCGATIKELAPGKPVSLGRTNPSSRVYILDRHERLVPPGTVGEIYLAGIQVSKGYIGLPSHNAARFLPDSIMPQADQQMYKTGDYAYWDSDTGEICIVGRKDRQIKLRGFRIDLDDLEIRVARAVPNCNGAAVFRRADYLVAVCQIPTLPTQPLGRSDIRNLIRDALPPYAMPRVIFTLPKLPHTTRGKLDYGKLENMKLASAAKMEWRKDRMTETETMIADALRSLMKLHSDTVIDRDSDLIMLGAHSIVQLQLASRLSSVLGRKFTVKSVIENPILWKLAALVDDARKAEVTTNTILAEPAVSPQHSSEEHFASEVSRATPIESVWFERYEQNIGTSAFNVSHVSELHGSFVQHDQLVSAWTSVLTRHAILRCRFRRSLNGDGTVERFYSEVPPTVQFVDAFDLQASVNAEFKLGTDHPIRVVVSRTHMLVCLSHIICDYTTLNRLFEEFLAEFHGSHSTEGVSVPSKRDAIGRKRQSPVVDTPTATFWQSYLSGTSMYEKPSYIKQHRTSHSGDSLMFRLSQEAVHNLANVSRSLLLTKHQIALAIVSLALQAENPHKQDLILGSPYLGRQEEDMDTIGLFLQPLPIRVPRRWKTDADLSDASVANYLLAVQDSARAALSNGVDWTMLLQILSAAENADFQSAAAATRSPSPNHPLFDAMVTFHERTASGKTSPLAHGAIAGVAPLITWTKGAKFGIMFEFSAVTESVLTLRIEYDTLLFSTAEVMALTRRINAVLENLSEGALALMQLRDLEKRLVETDGDSYRGSTLESIEFGKRVDLLV